MSTHAEPSYRFPIRLLRQPAAVPPLLYVPEVVVGVVLPKVKLSVVTAVTVPDALSDDGVIPVTLTGSLRENP